MAGPIETALFALGAFAMTIGAIVFVAISGPAKKKVLMVAVGGFSLMLILVFLTNFGVSF